MGNLNLAVVGGGSGSYTMAGDFVLAGHRVRMWPGARQKHAELYRNGTIVLEGLGRTGPYLTRKVEPTIVQVSGLAAHLPMGVFPACNTDRTFEQVSRLYPAAHPVENALSVALLNVGPIIHSVLFLLNTGAIEHFPAWDIHNEGTTQSVKKLVLAHDAERLELRKALGYTSHHYPFEDHYRYRHQGRIRISSGCYGPDRVCGSGRCSTKNTWDSLNCCTCTNNPEI